MHRLIRLVIHGACGLAALVALLGLATCGRGDPGLFPPAAGAAAVQVAVVDHGYHAGLIVPAAAIGAAAAATGDPALAALHARFAAYPWLEFGWGDGEFYRFAPALSDVTVAMAVGALAGVHDVSVLHVVGLDRPAAEAFPGSDVQALHLSQQGFAALAAGISESVALGDGQPEVLGPGLYGASLFYRAEGRYSLLNTCNHWLGRLLAAAGLKISPLPSATSAGLLAELRWRNGL